MKLLLVAICLSSLSTVAAFTPAAAAQPPNTNAAAAATNDPQQVRENTALHQALSSKDLKEQEKSTRKRKPKVVTRRRRTGADIGAVVRRLALSREQQQQLGSTTTTNVVGDLTELTKAIDRRLEARKGSQSSFVNGLIQQSRDSMGALLRYDDDDDDDNDDDNDDRKHRASRTGIKPYEIVVVFGKPLIDDQVTVEYAARLRTLARLVANTHVDVICFCDGDSNNKGNHIATADAGFLFFKHLCINEGIVLSDNIKMFIDRTSSRTEQDTLEHVTAHIMNDHVSEWLAVSQHTESPTDEYGMERRGQLRKKVHLHFTLLSTEYHLCNLNDVHYTSPTQTLLRPIEKLRTLDRSHEEIMSDDDFRSETKGRPSMRTINGIIDCSWSFQYATYPYSPDRSSAFMGQCFLLAEQLLPLYMNVKGVVADREFLQRDNYIHAATIRHKLVALMEQQLLGDQQQRQTQEMSTIVLEGATLSLGRCIDLLRPAGLHQSSVSKAEYVKALRFLQHCRNQIATYCDPDRPLQSSEWGTMGSLSLYGDDE